MLFGIQGEMPETFAYLNHVATAVPPHEAHGAFLRHARKVLGPRELTVFERLVHKGQVDRRYAAVEEGVYGERFPSTAERMRLYERHAPELAANAARKLDVRGITHLVVTSCTGMYAPGLDFDLIQCLGLGQRIERTMIGFMGCNAAMNALKVARHTVRSEPAARVLVVNLELCSLHLHATTDLEQMLAFALFGDGCAASVVSAEPRGLALERFEAVLVPEASELITWRVGNSGFEMHLSSRVPATIGRALRAAGAQILEGAQPSEIDLWAVHPGGRSVLDAVQQALELRGDALDASRDVLRNFGNMSSATVMFVLESLMKTARPGQRGCAMSFGPGLTAETFRFRSVGA